MNKEQYKKLAPTPWTSPMPIWSHAVEDYFYSEEEVGEYLEKNGADIEDLMLVHVEYTYFKKVTASDLGDVELPEIIAQKLAELNQAITAYGPAKVEITDKAASIPELCEHKFELVPQEFEHEFGRSGRDFYECIKCGLQED